MQRLMLKLSMLAIILFGLLALFSSTPARATPGALTIDVNNSSTDAPDANPGDGVCETAKGNGICTLRAAIMEANAYPGVETVNLQAGVTYVLTRAGADNTAVNGDLDINGAGIILNGNNATIDGGGIDRIFDINPLGASTRDSMSNLTIRNGSPVSALDTGIGILNSGYLTLTNVVVRDNVGAGVGNAGAIYNGSHSLTLVNSTVFSNTAVYAAGIQNQDISGSVTLINSTISNNTTTAGPGGGILNQSGSVTLINSTMSGNFANHTAQGNGNGGAIYNGSGGTVTLVNSTLSDNAADDNGGGIYNVDAGSTINLRNATVAFNYANADATGTDGAGGGIYNYLGAVNLANAIVSNSGAFLVGPDDCWGSLNSEGYNLVQNVLPACTIGGNTTGNKKAQDPLLGSLAYNGGPTKTRALLAGSPAIDAGNLGGCTDPLGALLPTDQRGFARTVNGGLALRCDMGAFEYYAKKLLLPFIAR